MHVEQSKLSLNVPRKADEECRQTLLGRGDLEASISNFFFFLMGTFFLISLKQLKDERLVLDCYEHIWKSGPGMMIWSLST